MSAQRKRRRALLIATFLVFLLPIVGAWMLNIFAPGWRPFGTTNHGTLVEPVRAVTARGLQRVDGRAMDPAYLSGRWTLVHVYTADCDQVCVDALARSYQVQQALGEDVARVQLLLVLSRSEDAPSVQLPAGVAQAVASGEWLASFSFAQPPGGPAAHIYLVDPQGYLMMRYAEDVTQRGLLSDLERLLKISKIG